MSSNTTITPASLVQVLGGEPHLLDQNVEIEGVQAMMEALTADEMAALSDPSMPMRHLRAEKVSPVVGREHGINPFLQKD